MTEWRPQVNSEESRKPAERIAEPLIVAIDGPSGVGKSTAAKALAAELGVPYLDTGTMYRAVAVKALDQGLDLEDQTAIESLAGEIDVRLDLRENGSLAVWVDGEAVDERLRTQRVSEASSIVSVYPGVRCGMVKLQREWASRSGGVVEGRDIGTKVFPDTPFKFFLEASVDVRGQRRYDQLASSGLQVSDLDSVIEDVSRRDERDSGREESPLTKDDSYLVINTDNLSPAEVVAVMIASIRRHH